ncbi:MAG: hemerythrin domain-containing protein [Acidimicrobiales bacterium]
MPTIDTSDMICVHDVLRRAFSEAPFQIAMVSDGDVEHSERVASYIEEVLWLLRVHHEGEDELLYPLLALRAPQSEAIFSAMEGQHAAVAAGLDAAGKAARAFAGTASTADGGSLATECRALLGILAPHLSDEEIQVLPIASQTITEQEWAALPSHALSQYRGERLWLVLGLVFEAMPAAMQGAILAHVPPPVNDMWVSSGARAFEEELAAIRGH